MHTVEIITKTIPLEDLLWNVAAAGASPFLQASQASQGSCFVKLLLCGLHRAAKGGRQKGIGKKVTKKRAKGYQKSDRK